MEKGLGKGWGWGNLRRITQGAAPHAILVQHVNNIWQYQHLPLMNQVFRIQFAHFACGLASLQVGGNNYFG